MTGNRMRHETSVAGAAHEFTQYWAHRLNPSRTRHRVSLDGPVLAAELGLDKDLPPVRITAVPHETYDPSSYRLRGARITHQLSDGDTVDRLLELPVRTVHPGHGASFTRGRLQETVRDYLRGCGTRWSQ